MAGDRTVRRPSLGAVVPPIAVLGAVVLTWHVWVTRSGVPEVIVPAPLDVVEAGLETAPTLAGDAAVTATTAALGLFGGVVLSVVLAFAAVQSRAAAAVITPAVLALRISPVVAIGPLLFLWIGSGVPARAALVATITVFPLTIASIEGLRSVPREYVDTARSVAAPRYRTFLRVRTPAAAPSVLAGLKLGATLSVIGAVVAEFVTLDSGLGYRVFVTSTRLETAQMYAALVALAVLGLVFYAVPVVLEWRYAWTADG